jgi:mannose-6-phosphate isomerase-like protein (cupin superfamily)
MRTASANRSWNSQTASEQWPRDKVTSLFSDMKLPVNHDVLAPDGSQVRLLPTLAAGGMAHFRLQAGQVSRAVRHRTVEEIWYILDGQGEIWRSLGGQEAVTELSPGMCLTIPAGTEFQFRASTAKAVSVIAVTMPPWPGADEAIEVNGK